MSDTTTPTSFDLIVIGGGSGGVRAARFAAQRGAKVAIVERSHMGGTCVNLGCIPKKMYSYAAHHGEAFGEARAYGWQVPQGIALDWDALKLARAREITHLNGIYEGLMTNAAVQQVTGHAKLLPSVNGVHRVQVSQAGAALRTLSAPRIVLATGGQPALPQLPGIELAASSNEMFDLPAVPGRLLVVGAGYIACEMASIFMGLGSEVHLLIRGEQVLRNFDEEIAAFALDQLKKRGLQVHTDVSPQALSQLADGQIRLQSEDGRQFDGDVVLMATGRKANVTGLGLEAVGLATNRKGAIDVNEQFETAVPGIFALGDVIGRLELTPVALAEAMVLVDHLFGPAAGKTPRRMNYEQIPTAVFTHPSIGTVGLSEARAREVHGAIEVYTGNFRPLQNAIPRGPARELIKVVVAKESQRVVGLHMVGDDAAEIVQGFAVAMRAGLTKAHLDETIGIHPTSAEEFFTLRIKTRD